MFVAKKLLMLEKIEAHYYNERHFSVNILWYTHGTPQEWSKLYQRIFSKIQEKHGKTLLLIIYFFRYNFSLQMDLFRADIQCWHIEK